MTVVHDLATAVCHGAAGQGGAIVLGLAYIGSVE